MTWWYENEPVIQDYDKEKGWHYRPIKERKMEFDRSRIYSAVNADELKSGDKVIVAGDMASLRTNVEHGQTPFVIKDILIEDESERFRTVGFGVENDWPLAYLVERVENCGNCGDRGCPDAGEDCKFLRCADWQPKAEPKTEKSCTKCRMATKLSDGTLACDVDGYPVDCTPPHDEACSDYKPKKPSKICINCQHYALGICHKDNHHTNYHDTCEDFREATGEKKYRPFKDTDELIKVWLEKGSKWQKRELTMPLIWVRRKEGNIKGQLITEFSNSLWVEMGKEGYNMTDLLVHFTFLDGSICGVEE